jgi:hypothetical protein
MEKMVKILEFLFGILGFCAIWFENVWEKLGCPPLTYGVFASLAKMMTPASTTELLIVRRINGVLKILCTKRPDSDPDYSGQWHYTGGAAPAFIFLGADNFEEYIYVPWITKLVKRAMRDKFIWNIRGILQRILARILVKEKLGLSNDQIISLVQATISVGHTYTLTPRSGEGNNLCWCPADEAGVFITSSSIMWLSVEEMKEMALKGEFIKHQIPNLELAIELHKKFENA